MKQRQHDDDDDDDEFKVGRDDDEDDEFDRQLLQLDLDNLQLLQHQSSSTAFAHSTTSNKPKVQVHQKRSVTAGLDSNKRSLDDSVVDDYDNPAYAVTGFGQGGLYLRNKRKKLDIQYRANNEETLVVEAETRRRINLAKGDQEGDGVPLELEKPKPLFKNMSIYINGYTEKVGLDELHRLIHRHGGTYIPYLDKKSLVTHIIATNLTPSKRKEFSAYKVAHPNWILDSIKEGKLKSWQEYNILSADFQGGAAEASQFGWSEDAERGKKTERSLWGMMGGGQKKKEVEVPEVSNGKGKGREREEHVALAEKKKSKSGSKSKEVVLDDGVLEVTEEDDDEDDNIPASKPPQSVSTSISIPLRKTPATSAIEETIESLGERGMRLAREALALQREQVESPRAAAVVDFFAPRTNSSSTITTTTNSTSNSPSRPTSPSKDSNPAPPTTDMNAPIEFASTYLPSRRRTEHAEALLRDPNWRARHTSTSGEPFLSEYFGQSRLHHLSTWKEELKSLVAELQPARKDAKCPTSAAGGQGKGGGGGGRKKLKGTEEDGRTIMHVDFDCFFVSAGLTTRPELRGKPVAVCHGGRQEGAASTSEIASCSYEAREMGVKNGISLGKARELCPDIISIPFEFSLYKSIAAKFYQITLDYADFLQGLVFLFPFAFAPSAVPVADPKLQNSNTSSVGNSNTAVSIDEVLMEVTVPPPSPSGSKDPALDLADRLRSDIREATGCEVSVGISSNILLARLASRKAKPAGAVHLLPDMVPTLLSDLPVDSLPGIGWSLRRKLDEELDVHTVGDLLKFSKSQLQNAIGQVNGEKFYQFARGIDPRELEGPKVRQSVSAEINYGIRFETGDEPAVERFVRLLGEEVVNRLKKEDMKSRHLTLKVMERHPDAPVEAPKFLGHGHCETHNKSVAIYAPGAPSKATDDADIVGNAAWALLKSLKIPPHELRGIGITLAKLEGKVTAEPAREKGQGMLSFGASKATAAPRPVVSDQPVHGPSSAFSGPSRKVIVEDHVTRSKDLEKKVSVIVIDSSDSSSDVEVGGQPAAVPAKAPSPKKPQPLPTKQPKVAALFRTSKARVGRDSVTVKPVTVSDAELAHLGIDTDFWLALDPITQGEVLSDRRLRAPPFTKAMAKAYEEKEARKRREQSKEKSSRFQVVEHPKPTIPALPEHVVSSSPTNTQIEALGIDLEVYHSLPEELQREQLKNRKRFAVRGISRTSNKDKARSSRFSDIHIFLPAKFGGKSDLEGVREMLEQWLETEALEGPNEEDVAALEKFLEKRFDPARGQDLEMVTGLVSWLQYMVELEVGPEQSACHGAAGDWWSVVNRLRDRVSQFVKMDYGLQLAC
ncbi:DNA repair protein [Meredithblackwellia eburnea MCA 4105]